MDLKIEKREYLQKLDGDAPSQSAGVYVYLFLL